MLKLFMDFALDAINKNPDLIAVSKQEYEIMCVREGELHDTSLVESALRQSLEASASGSANLKRENKTYSYKEQVAELELRKELDAKKQLAQQQKLDTLKQNVLANLEQIKALMNKKQQEALDQQVQRETRIRDEMRVKDRLVAKSTAILCRLVEANHMQVRSHVSAVMRATLRVCRSPLCAPYAFRVLDTIATHLYSATSGAATVHQVVNFNRSVCYATFRLCNAPLAMPKEWLDEPLDKACARLVQRIKRETLAQIADDDFELSKSSLFYPFFKVKQNIHGYLLVLAVDLAKVDL